MTLKFKKEDFKTEYEISGGVHHGFTMYSKTIEYKTVLSLGAESAAKQAQELFDKWLSEQPVVYGGDIDSPYWTETNVTSDIRPLRKARLVDIQEIKKCEHPKEKIKEIESTDIKDFLSPGVIIPGSSFLEGKPVSFPARYKMIYKCECGAKVKPAKWEQCDD